jgi:hypothetical protein
MKVIIAGTRSVDESPDMMAVLEEAISESGFGIDEVVSGGASGVDRLGEKWACAYNKPVQQFLPDWDRFGKAAGPKRNTQMLEYADALLALWDGESKGTKNIIDQAHVLMFPVYVYKLK